MKNTTHDVLFPVTARPSAAAGQGMTAILLSSFLLALCLFAGQAYADITFTLKTTLKDGSEVPAGTIFGFYSGSTEFPGTATWVLPTTVPPEPKEYDIGAGPATPAEFYCAQSICSGYISFYTSDSEKKTCSETCDFTTKHWAFYGNVKGTVRLSNGMPVRGSSVSAIDPTRNLAVDWGKSAPTDYNGQYSFASKKARIYTFQYLNPLLKDFDIPESNNWGLKLDQVEPHEAPSKKYLIRSGRTTREVIVQSSSAKTEDFVIPFEEEKDDPPNKNCSAGESDEEPSCLQDASCIGKPISVATGNVFFDETDVALPGTVPLRVHRTYNSADAFANKQGLFGRGWSSTYDREIVVVRDGILAAKQASGNLYYFTEQGTSGIFKPFSPASGRSWITSQPDGGHVRTLLSGRQEIYNAQHALTGLVDPAGNATTLGRNGSGRLTTVAAPGGRSLTLQYGAGGFVSSVSGPEGTIATYDYTGPFLTRVTYADGTGNEYAYDDLGQILQVRDLSGTVVESHAYTLMDGKPRGITSEVADGVEKLTLNYGPDSTTVTDALGNATTYDLIEVNELKHVAKITGPCSACGGAGGDTEEFGYYSDGRIQMRKDSLGQMWSYTYDAAGNQNSVTDPVGGTTTYTFDEHGRALTATAPMGGTSTVTYSAAGLASTVSPMGRTTTVSRTSNGLVSSATNARQATYVFGYNAHGDMTSVRNPLNAPLLRDVDAMGRTTRITSALGHGVSYKYNNAGRIVRVEESNGTYFLFSYDRAGRLISVTDAAGRKTSYKYDRYGRMSAIVDPLNSETMFGYDMKSRLTSIIDARGNRTQFVPDPFGRLASIVYPDGRGESYGYDAAGRLRTWTDRNGVVHTYNRNELGLLTSKTYSNGAPATTLTYDARHRLATSSNGVDQMSWTYDDDGRLISESSILHGTTLAYAYTDDGLRESMRLNGTEWLHYGWDDAAHLTSIQRGSHAFAFTYDDDAQRTSLDFPNGVHTSYTYDPSSQRLTQLNTNLGAATISQTEYQHDLLGNRTQKTTPTFAETYAYDPLDRLTGVERGSATPAAHWHFDYDPLTNRKVSQAGDVVVSAQFDADNRLLSTIGGGSLVVQGQLNEPGSATVNGQPARMLTSNIFEATVPTTPGVNDIAVLAKDLSGNERSSSYAVTMPTHSSSYQYDPNGNLTQRVDGTGTWTYEWSADNQLSRVLKDGAERARFRYDPLGRRVEKVAAGVTTRYLYDGMDILRESRSDGTTWTYVHGPGIDEPLARAVASGGLSYYHADGLGSILKMTDQAGAVSQSRQYDAWGNLEVGADQPGYAFTGREWDPEIGLYYYRARYYDPEAGRFINEDPLGLLAGPNAYGYVDAHPVNRTDPSGLFFAPWHQEITKSAALAAGMGFVEAMQLSYATAWVDFRKGSTDLENALWHAMSKPGQKPEKAEELMNQYVEERLRDGDLAAALHAIQDAHASGHESFQCYTGMGDILGEISLGLEGQVSIYGHAAGDVFPSPSRLAEAAKLSEAMIRRYQAMHAQDRPVQGGGAWATGITTPYWLH